MSSAHQNSQSFLHNTQTAQGDNRRLDIFIAEYKRYKQEKQRPLKILDIACGKNPVIFNHKFIDDYYVACDYFDSINYAVEQYIQIDLNVESLVQKCKREKFDIIFCGEVIEHLFSPDHLIDELHMLMHNDSILILSTPNLGYYMNRIMLLVGISPFFLENSSEYKFGRRFRFLGQMNKTEGHIRLFTFRALKEFVLFHGFRIVRITSSVGPWNFFLDTFFALVSKSLAATNVFVLRINKHDD